MRRLIVLTVALLLLVPPGQAFAHGLGQRQDLPLPSWLYLFAASAVVLVSFVQFVLFGLRLLSVVLFLLIILSGLLGVQAPSSNFAPTFVWIIWSVGLSFFTAFGGNIWPLVNPWKILFEWAEEFARLLGIKRGLYLGAPYPASWGVWPALALYALFVWVENVFEGSATPLNIALLALLY